MGAGDDTSSAEVMDLKKKVDVIKKESQHKTVEIEDLKKKVDVIKKESQYKTVEIKDLEKKLSNTQTCLDTTKADYVTLIEQMGETQTLLNSKIADIEVWEKKDKKLRKSEHRLAIKEAKSRMMEEFDVAANKFQASLPYFLVFLGIFFSVKLTCKTRAFFLCLVGSSSLGIFLFAIIGVFRTLQIFRSFYSKRKIHRGGIAAIGGQEGSDGHDSDSDIDLEGNVPEEWSAIMYKQWLSFAWPTIAHISILVLFSWGCNIGIGMYIFNEGCVNDSTAQSPLASPVFSSMDYIEYMED